MNILYGVLIARNIIVFIIYGMDKQKSIKGKWRIKESTLILLAFLMGGVGAVSGMSVFRHKTRHLKFKILMPLALLLNVAVLVGGFYFAKRYL